MNTLTEIADCLREYQDKTKPFKNTINRHYYEMSRLESLHRRGYISKERAVEEFKRYLETVYGRKLFRPFPYKVA